MASLVSFARFFGKILAGGAVTSLVFLAVACEPEATKPSPPATGGASKPSAPEASKPSAPEKAATPAATIGAPAAAGGKTAKAAIEGRSGSKLTGEVTFVEADGVVKVMVHVMSAPPGKHAVHIHEKGDCSFPDAKSAGGHFNPGGAHKHGAPDAADHHPGDFGNMEVGADGHGMLQLTSKDITVKAGPNSVVGLAIIVHDKEDDMTTQPTGNAGDRIGCGVIQAQ